MLSLKFYPSYIPLYATIHGLFSLFLLYLVAVYYDHVQPFVPFVSALGIYPPEQYMFMCLMGSYGVMIVYYNWIGNIVFAGSNFFYIREYEPGYVEFNKCAFSEWLAIFSLLEITLITGLELRNHEIQNEETNHDIYAILAA
ncbi:prokaryotic DNA topoisomerase [Schistosoma japonicum]|nr:prokaryotic DNA topoisomerase [Schistosoma japonicum]